MIRFRYFSLVFVLFLLVSLATPVMPAQAQNQANLFEPGASLRFEHLNIDNGLSQNAGLSIIQDTHGFMWIGTQDGLNRYDGQKFQIYKNDPDDPASLSQNSITALFEDPQGNIWVGTWGGGLNRFDPHTSKFTRFIPDPAKPGSLSSPIVTSLAMDSTGRFWVGTLGGLDLFDPAAQQFTHYRNDPKDPASLSSSAVSAILPGPDGKLWVGTGGLALGGAGLNHFDSATGKAERMPARQQCLSGANISSLVFDKAGLLWIGSGGYSLPGNGLDRLDPATGQCDHFDIAQGPDASMNTNNVIKILIDGNNQLWATTWGGGLARIDLSAPGKIYVYQNDPASLSSLSNNALYALALDRSGLLWVGSLNSGLNLLNIHNQQFHLYEQSPSGLASNLIGGFAETPDGQMWVGTWDKGLERFNPLTGQFEHFVHNPQDPASLASNVVMYIQPDPDGSLWVATLGAGLDHFDPATGKAEHYVNDPANSGSLVDNNVVSLFREPQGRLWVGTMTGLDRLDPDAREFVHYKNDPQNPASLSNNSTVSFWVSGQTLWIGTWGGGLNRLDLSDPASLNPASARFQVFRHDPQNQHSLGDDSVWAITGDRSGNIWLGTQGGLDKLDANGNNIKMYREKDGLRNTTVMGVVQDAAGNLWLTTNNGLGRLDQSTEIFSFYDKSDGMQGNEFNSNALLKTRQGLIYAGGSHGFNVFNPAQIQPNPVPPQVAITGFKIFNTPAAVDLSGMLPLKLNYDQNFISFEFAALDFQAPGKNHYAYKLEGFDKDWVDAGTRNYASYTNLPGGSYVFHVRAANSGGVWNETGVSLPLGVTPPFWMTWEFIAVSVIGLAVLLVLGFQWRVRAVRQQNIRLEALLLEQQRAEAELRLSEARFRAVFENSALGVVILDLTNLSLRYNDVCRKLVEDEHLPATLNNVYEFVSSRYRQVEAPIIDELMNDHRESYTTDHVYRRPGAEPVWSHITVSAVKDASGKIRYLVGMLEDITQQRKDQEKLGESDARFRAMFENSAVGMGLMSLDRKLTDANQAMCDLLGYTREELMGVSPVLITHPDDMPASAALHQDMMAGKIDHYTSERRYYRKNGELFWAQVSMSLVYDPNRTPLYIVGMIQDIDQQKRAVEGLRESEARFRAMYDNAAVGMSMMSLDRKVISINPTAAQMTGYTFEELYNTDPSLLSYPEDRPIGVEQFRQMVAGELSGFQMEKRFLRKNGELFWGRVTYSTVPDGLGRPQYLVGIIEDITLQRQAAQKLVEQEAEYRRTLEARVEERTHELASTNERLTEEIEQRKRAEEALAAKAADDAVAAERTRLARDLHDAVTQTLFASSLIAEVLPDLWEMDVDEAKRSTEELRQLTRGALAEMRTLLLELRPSALTQSRLGDLIRQLCEALIGRSRLPIKLEVEGDRGLPPEVLVAFYRIAQESLNNVFKYARASSVDVALLLSPAGAHLEICDNGIGFDVSKQKSTSLGLRIMRERAEAIGADISITSKPGAGTCIEVDWIEKPDMKLSVFKK